MSGQSADFKNDLVVTPSVFPQSIAAGTVNGAAVDAINLSEMGAKLGVGAVVGASTVDVKIQESAVQGSGFQDLVPAVAFAQVSASNPTPAPVLNFKRTLRFVRAVAVVAGTSALVAVDIIGSKKVY